MTATNHALTGAAIGLLVGEPLLAIPAALASHFICDALPHFGMDGQGPLHKWLRSRTFRNYLIADALLCVLLVGVLALTQPAHWLLAAICAFVATSPDFLWIPKYIAAKRGKPERRNWFTKWAGDIQWFQRPIGAIVEFAWFIAGCAVLWKFIR